MVKSRLILFSFYSFVLCLAQDVSTDVYVTTTEANDVVATSTLRVMEDTAWEGYPNLKQVAAVSVDTQGHLHVFHSGDRVWDLHTFDAEHRLVNSSQGPIPNDTIFVVDAKLQQPLYSWGSDKFYMPHGLNVDKYGNSYVTDVGLHQVMRFPAGSQEPDVVLGTALEPGRDHQHFCQPSNALSDDQHIFVSDGYCNSRIVVFSMDGQYVTEFGAEENMNIPYSLSLSPEKTAILVTDPENGRILCFSTGADDIPIGTLLSTIEGQGLSRVFAAVIRGNYLFALNGADSKTKTELAEHGLVFDKESKQRILIWSPHEGLIRPQGMSVSPDGKTLYVSESAPEAPKHIYRFFIRK